MIVRRECPVRTLFFFAMPHFYHGTSTFEGSPLDTSIATDQDTRNFPNSNAGFYLATDPDTAVHFAATAGQNSGTDPAVITYYINNTALNGLKAAGAVLGPYLEPRVHFHLQGCRAHFHIGDI